jgi:hypothetical protein
VACARAAALAPHASDPLCVCAHHSQHLLHFCNPGHQHLRRQVLGLLQKGGERRGGAAPVWHGRLYMCGSPTSPASGGPQSSRRALRSPARLPHRPQGDQLVPALYLPPNITMTREWCGGAGARAGGQISAGRSVVAVWRISRMPPGCARRCLADDGQHLINTSAYHATYNLPFQSYNLSSEWDVRRFGRHSRAKDA